MLCSILLSVLTERAEEIIGDHQCGFRPDKWTNDYVFCIRHIIKKKWEENEAVNQMFVYFKKTYGAVRLEVLYNILLDFGIPMKTVV